MKFPLIRWKCFFNDFFGYPHRKQSIFHRILGTQFGKIAARNTRKSCHSSLVSTVSKSCMRASHHHHPLHLCLLAVKALILIHEATSKDLRDKSLATGTGWTSWVFIGPRSIRTVVLGCIRLQALPSLSASAFHLGNSTEGPYPGKHVEHHKAKEQQAGDPRGGATEDSALSSGSGGYSAAAPCTTPCPPGTEKRKASFCSCLNQESRVRKETGLS